MSQSVLRMLFALVMSLSTLTLAGAAQAGGREVERQGPCSGRSDWKIKAKTENAGIELESTRTSSGGPGECGSATKAK